MPTLLQLTPSDRVLVLAPHPDDESIACGGLLLAAREAGAERCVVIVTDGDNNPWPQRWIEKRWRIDAAARARWGARRRAEASAALDLIGVAPEYRHFLGFPDSELTASLMQDDRLSSELGAAIDAFRPTHIAVPALFDEHPDHSAVHVAARLALSRRTSPSPQLLVYTVHGQRDEAGDAVLRLSERQRQTKRDAILKHDTQMRLSGGRFLRFAGEIESYDETGVSRVPLRSRRVDAGIEIRVARRELRDAARKLQLLLIATPSAGETVRLRLPVAQESGKSAPAGTPPAQTPTVEWAEDGNEAIVLVRMSAEVRSPAFVKLETLRRGLVIYDRYGWQEVENKA